MSRANILFSAFLFTGLSLFHLAACGSSDVEGDDDSSDVPAPTDIRVQMVNQQWEGWETYTSDDLDVSIKVRFLLYEYKDGQYCGKLGLLLNEPGTYVAYKAFGVWVVGLEVTDDNSGDYAPTFMRTYGTLDGYLAMQGWYDNVDAVAGVNDPYAVPPMDEGTIAYEGKALSQDLLTLDPVPMDLSALISGLRTSSPEAPQDAPEGTEDLPAFSLPASGPVESTEEEQAEWCGWLQGPATVGPAARMLEDQP